MFDNLKLLIIIRSIKFVLQTWIEYCDTKCLRPLSLIELTPKKTLIQGGFKE